MTRPSDMAPETLFYPFEKALLPRPQGRVLFMNGRRHTALKAFGQGLVVQQNWKSFADELEASGLSATTHIPDGERFEAILILSPKNQTEAEFGIARALSLLEDGGLLAVAADNKAGGARLEKSLQKFGLGNIHNLSKHKARVCWTRKDNIHADAIKIALENGSMQPVLGGRYRSQPGLFGWDKVDKGSEILLRHLPEDLLGRGADFGCGYGYLACAVLQHEKVEHLYCIDADFRAVEACRLNLGAQKDASAFTCLWGDLIRPVKGVGGLDFIVMNPPFHEGPTSDTAIGKGFIRTAHSSLKPGGILWMVANAHLPYEDTLKDIFPAVSKSFEGQGYKVYRAQK